MQEAAEKYLQAGKVAAEIKQEVLRMISPGLRILEIAEYIEKRVVEKEARLAFPPNISINAIAAHYTPCFNDRTIVQDGDLVKIDIGVHIDGYMGDLAFTYCSNGSELIEAAEKALDSAVRIIRPGIAVSAISAAVEDSVRDSGLGLVTNLTGHGLDKFSFHHPPSIPNVRNNIGHIFREGDAIAIEPFVLASDSQVKEAGTTEIYRFYAERPVRMQEARQLLVMAKAQYMQLPFAKRWLYARFSHAKIALSLRQLEEVKALEAHPVLREPTGQPIAQAEHTIIVADKPMVTTRLD